MTMEILRNLSREERSMMGGLMGRTKLDIP
jgi:hypothetical protein